jgi:hypothetical protein
MTIRDGKDVRVIVSASAADALDILRVNYAFQEHIPNSELLDHVASQGVTVTFS